MTTVFREMLQAPGVIHAPIAYDPLTARIAESVGFRCLDIGGYALGASSCVPEPLLSLEEVIMATRRIKSSSRAGRGISLSSSHNCTGIRDGPALLHRTL